MDLEQALIKVNHVFNLLMSPLHAPVITIVETFNLLVALDFSFKILAKL